MNEAGLLLHGLIGILYYTSIVVARNPPGKAADLTHKPVGSSQSTLILLPMTTYIR